jgi:hypothetical protein
VSEKTFEVYNNTGAKTTIVGTEILTSGGASTGHY